MVVNPPINALQGGMKGTLQQIVVYSPSDGYIPSSSLRVEKCNLQGTQISVTKLPIYYKQVGPRFEVIIQNVKGKRLENAHHLFVKIPQRNELSNLPSSFSSILQVESFKILAN
ncbi:hypothetical protein Nepgr_016044 [Nepenthes gracilis]|uniref:Uncharacterized protein n=1 Tax=Nepenthes gracilis TaxID=150966 RepID=A0AAD3XR93_NEPGR|nr:hypothetical protein Nepgr_016044 [Nepenthes gracilis]